MPHHRNYPWIWDILRWKAMSLPDQLEMLRKHYCTGPRGQSSCTDATVSATNVALSEAIVILRGLEKENQNKSTTVVLREMEKSLNDASTMETGTCCKHTRHENAASK